MTLVVSAWFLAQRIRAYYDANPRPIYYFQQPEGSAFTFRGRTVRFTDQLEPDGSGVVRLEYDDDSLELPVEVPTDVPLPGMSRHRDWLHVTAFAEATDLSRAQFDAKVESGEIVPRLIVVTRRPVGEAPAEPSRLEEGLGVQIEHEDDWGWNEVRRDRWTFTFHELLPEGGFHSQTLKFPESGSHFYRRQIRAEREGLPPPVRDPDELKEGTWQFLAALPLMKRAPGITKEEQALRSAGWTLPAASASIIALIASLAFALAPTREQVERRASAR